MITIGDNADGKGNDICVADGGNTERQYKIISYCDPPLKGRYVHVMLKGAARVLTLCEIQVYTGNWKVDS